MKLVAHVTLADLVGPTQAARAEARSKCRRATVEIARLDRSLLVRAKLDPILVRQYATEMEAGDEFPPIIVFEDQATRVLVVPNGQYRIEARLLLAEKFIEALILTGDRREAFLFALGLDRGRGRSNADKRFCVEQMLHDPVWAKWSDEEVGRRCGVDGKTVALARRRLGVTADVRRTSDGREMNTLNLGPRPPRTPRRRPFEQASPESTSEIPKCSEVLSPTQPAGVPAGSTSEIPKCSGDAELKPSPTGELDLVLPLLLDGTPYEVREGGRTIVWRVVSSDAALIVVHGRVQASLAPESSRVVDGELTVTRREGSRTTPIARDKTMSCPPVGDGRTTYPI
jgi:hypothetical protein